MRYLALSMILAVSFTLPDRPNPLGQPKKATDFEALQGAWVVIDYETQTGKMDAQFIKNHNKMVVNGDQYGWSMPNGGSFRLDPTKTPKTIDYWIGPGNDPRHAWQGIYELNGDIFRDCIAPPGQLRPSDFSTPPGSNRVMQTFQRVK